MWRASLNPIATIANAAFAAGSLRATAVFARALADPAVAQAGVLRRLISANQATAFGREHCFSRIRNVRDYRQAVPVRGYDEFVPYIDRIRAGAAHVLTAEPVVRLVPTSGSTGGRKLIPHTRSLQREFDAATGPWMTGMFRDDPRLMTGSAYWSVTPVGQTIIEPSAVPIGFGEDTEYLGGFKRRLVDSVMAVPSSVGRMASVEACLDETARLLRGRRDLRLISVWHPSFLLLLMDRIGADWKTLWPELRAISCWTDGHAAASARMVAERFEGVTVVGKGVIATEGVVSVPWGIAKPQAVSALAVTSHFLEFVRTDGTVAGAHELDIGGKYGVLLTTGGGLWRYDLGDEVEVTGFVKRTPTVRFVGRRGNVSDWRGEKLAEPFVVGVIETLRGEEHWAFALLAVEQTDTGVGYVLFVERGNARRDGSSLGRGCLSDHTAGVWEGDVSWGTALAHAFDDALRANPHYAYCRELKQLLPVRVFVIERGADAAYLARMQNAGQRLGDIKPAALSKLTGWANVFEGRYAE